MKTLRNSVLIEKLALMQPKTSLGKILRSGPSKGSPWCYAAVTQTCVMTRESNYVSPSSFFYSFSVVGRFSFISRSFPPTHGTSGPSGSQGPLFLSCFFNAPWQGYFGPGAPKFENWVKLVDSLKCFVTPLTLSVKD